MVQISRSPLVQPPARTMWCLHIIHYYAQAWADMARSPKISYILFRLKIATTGGAGKATNQKSLSLGPDL